MRQQSDIVRVDAVNSGMKSMQIQPGFICWHKPCSRNKDGKLQRHLCAAEVTDAL